MRRRRPPGRPVSPALGGWVRIEDAGPDDAGWVVRSVSGSAATKTYRCPGCGQEIAVGVPHVVAWPAGEPEGTGRHEAELSCRAGGGSQERRHWHTGCWRRRR